MRRPARLGLILLAAILGAPAPARPVAGDPRKAWFEDGRVGLTVSWGLHSLLEKGEWAMEADRLPVDEYAKLASMFKGSGFAADDWTRAAKGAGAKYLNVVAKGPDGFCLFDSKQTPFDVVDATPFAADPIKKLAEACRKDGLKLVVTYSLLDWRHPDYFPRGATGRAAGRRESGDWSAYVAYVHAQLRELCTNYGEIGGVRLEGAWDKPGTAWDLPAIFKLIRDLQPGAIIAIDHPDAAALGADVRLLEPDAEDAGSGAAFASEIVVTSPRHRGRPRTGKDVRTTEALIHALLAAAGRGRNLALDLPARPDGQLPSEPLEKLKEVGIWLEKNGRTVYRTHRGVIAPTAWGASTTKDETTHLHVLRPDLPILLPSRADAFVFTVGDGVKLATKPVPGGVQLDLPESVRTPIDTIVTMTPLVFEPADVDRKTRR